MVKWLCSVCNIYIYDEEKGILVGVDINGADSVNFSLAGKPVYKKTIDELRE